MIRPISLRGHEKPVTAVKFNFDGDLLFTASAEKKVNLWYLDGERIGSFETKAAVKTMDVTNDSEILIVGTNVGTLEFFKVDGGQRLSSHSADARIITVALSYGDKKLIVLSEWYSKEKVGTTDISIYDFEAIRSLIKTKPSEELSLKAEKIISTKDKYVQVAWGPLNETIYAARANGIFEIFNLDGTIEKSTKASDKNITSFSIAKEFAFIVVCSDEGVKIIDPETLETLKTVKTEVPMNAGAISPLAFSASKAKHHLIIGGGVKAIDAAEKKEGGFEVRLFNIMYEDELGRIAGSFGPVNTLNFYPDGRGFVSGGEEGVIRLYRFPDKYFSDPSFE